MDENAFEEVHAILVERHPLKYANMSFTDIFPFMNVFCSKAKKNKYLREESRILNQYPVKSDEPQISLQEKQRK